MKAPFRFFTRHSRDADFEDEFRTNYQEPGVSHLLVGCSFALLTFGGFYLLDLSLLPVVGGVQTFRLAVVATLALVLALIAMRREFAVRHYNKIANLIILGCIQSAAYVAYSARIHTSYVEMYWALTASLVTATVVIFGFSRLTAYNTLLLVLTGSASGLVYALSIPEWHPQQLGRLVTHLAIADLVCFSLRATLESRERELFLLAKENLRRNLYTKELEAAKLAAEQASQAKSRFLANMSHEIRTPMNALLQIMDLIGQSASLEERKLIAMGRSSANALLKVLNGILEYTKLSHGQDELRLSAVDLAVSLRTVADLYSAAALAKGISLSTKANIEPGCGLVLADEVKILEVINNLVSNAIKFTERGLVEVTLAIVESQEEAGVAKASLVVRDTGVGISLEHQGNIFKPFYQAQSSADRKQGGTGLGLAIVHGMVTTIMGGTVEVASTLGVGTRVTVELSLRVAPRPHGVIEPIEKDARQSPARPVVETEPEPDAKWARLSGRVLLVEDNELNALLAASLLQSFGLEIVLADNGRVGLAQLQLGGFDVVLMDCQMPEMDGYETTRRIRQVERDLGVTDPIPIIAVTAHALLGDRQKCLDSGMSDYVGKPYAREELFAVLERWLRIPRESELLQADLAGSGSRQSCS